MTPLETTAMCIDAAISAHVQAVGKPPKLVYCSDEAWWSIFEGNIPHQTMNVAASFYAGTRMVVMPHWRGIMAATRCSPGQLA